MKKTFCAASVFPSLLLATGVIFAASDGSVKQLSDVGGTIKEIMQEQKDFQAKPLPPPGWQPNQPGHPGQPPKPDHPVQPPRPPQPGQPGQPPLPPQPPAPVDTTHAYNAGLRDGNEKGVREGRREGYSDGVNEGEREGYRKGTDDGNRAGRETGYRDGYGVDQTMGTQNGSASGQTTGVNNGTEAGKRRCYDEGYTNGYNVSYEEARKLGLQDAASYSGGYAKGQADAATIEAGNGQKAGYQAGFSQRETELESASFDVRSMGGVLTKGVPGVKLDFNITQARYGYATPEERQAYDRGHREGYQRGYRRAYDEAKREGYNERFTMAYRRAYDAQYSTSYRNGYSEGKTAGYQAAYNSAYNSAYSYYYEEYSRREYADQRALGLSNGRTTGRKEGFEAGCAENTKRGYDDGYRKTAAEVYPGAFEAGKLSGIAAADKFYRENAVLKVSDIAFYDENGDGKFEANENVMLKAEVKNFGFKGSEAVAITIKSERGEILLVPDLKAGSVGGRTRTAVNLNIGKLYDVVAPDADALNVKFTEKGALVGERRQLYTRTNPNKVGTVEKDDTPVRKNSNVFSSTLAKLNKGEKVIIIGEKDYYTKVRKSAFAGGEWTEGYVYTDKLAVQ